MQTKMYISYDTVMKLLTPYFQKQYPDCKIYFYCKHDKSYSPDGWGFYDEYNIFSGYLQFSRNTIVFGQVKEISGSKNLDDNEIRNPLWDILDNELDREGNNLEVYHIEAGETSVEITITEKEKTLKKS